MWDSVNVKKIQIVATVSIATRVALWMLVATAALPLKHLRVKAAGNTIFAIRSTRTAAVAEHPLKLHHSSVNSWSQTKQRTEQGPHAQNGED